MRERRGRETDMLWLGEEPKEYLDGDLIWIFAGHAVDVKEMPLKGVAVSGCEWVRWRLFWVRISEVWRWGCRELRFSSGRGLG